MSKSIFTRKRAVLADLLAVFAGIAVLLLLKSALWRYHYTPETRKVLSHNLHLSRAYSPTMETNLCYSDAVIRVKVVSSGQNVDRIVLPDGKEQRVSFTDFRLKVLETLYGSADREELTLRLPGQGESGIAKPHKNDELVIFVRKNQYADTYTLTDMEASIFAVLPNDTLYSFEDMERFSQYDGKSLEELYTGIDETAAALNGCMPEYLTELPLEPGAVFRQLAEEAEMLGSSAESLSSESDQNS